MPDISMCLGFGQTNAKSDSIIDCPKKESCYRHKAKPSSHQTYLLYIPYDLKTETCDDFMELWNTVKDKKQNGRL